MPYYDTVYAHRVRGGILTIIWQYLSGLVPITSSVDNSISTDYVIGPILIYLIYKASTLYFYRPKISFTPLGLWGLALLHVFLLCLYYFASHSQDGSGVLFFKILFYSIFPTIFIIIASSFGRRIISYIPGILAEDGILRWLLGLGVGLATLNILYTIVASIGWYTLPIILLFLAAAGGWAYREIWETLVGIVSYRMEFPNHRIDSTIIEAVNLRLLSAEFAFFFITLVMGIDFVNIVRPMPIGWDDLGVYMNHPQMIALSGGLVRGIGMEAWQLFTAMGFLFHSAPQAFFLNELGGILSVIVIVSVLSHLLHAYRPTTVHLPMLFAALFYAMPMIVFQQAKDMKLDSGLFAISIIALYATYTFLLRYFHDDRPTSNTLQGVKPLKNDEICANIEHRSETYKGTYGEREVQI